MHHIPEPVEKMVRVVKEKLIGLFKTRTTKDYSKGEKESTKPKTARKKIEKQSETT